MHEIIRDDNGSHASADGLTISLLDTDGTMFRRRAIKNAGSDNAHEVEWLVVELDGVRVYRNGGHVIVTRQDMYP